MVPSPLAQFIETWRLRDGRQRLKEMDPAIKSYLDPLRNSLDANTAAMQAQTAKIDDLLSW